MHLDERVHANRNLRPNAVKAFRPSTFFSKVVQPKLTVNTPGDKYEKEADAMADHVMRSTTTVAPQGAIQRKCAECENEEKMQRKETGNTPVNASTGLSSRLKSGKGGGSEMPSSVKTTMNNAFGHDFSNVRIHADTEAARLNDHIQAKAFTYGNDIYFNAHQYSPSTSQGKHLLAHELTHVVQQGWVVYRKEENPCYKADTYGKTFVACPEGSTNIGKQAQGQANKIDASAQRIIDTAADQTVPAQDRAIKVVNDLICTYMPSMGPLVRKINYYSPKVGLEVRSVGSGATTTGDLCVGDQFLNDTTKGGIGRRALQVAHELQHIEQYRDGLAGGNKSTEREFLAFHTEGLSDEFIGTGRMSDSTRKNLIDEAIRLYRCFDAALKTTYESKLKELLDRRKTVNGTSGNKATDPPANCK